MRRHHGIAVQEGLDEEADRLIEAFDGDIQATWPYARALRRFRADGDSPAARRALAEAVKVNAHVVPFLLAPEEMPPVVASHFALGSPEEAAFVAQELSGAFEKTPGALAWLQSAPMRSTRRGRARRGSGKRSRRR